MVISVCQALFRLIPAFYCLTCFSFLSALLFWLSLTGCSCEHEWTAADCLNPQSCTRCQAVGEPALGHIWLNATCTSPGTCTRCSEKQGEPLDHDWEDATCSAPQACSRCSEVQGDPLAHAYGNWIFDGKLMNHTCAVCNHLEELPIDHRLYLEHILRGHWNLYRLDTSDATYHAQKLILNNPASNCHITFGSDNSCLINLPLVKIDTFDTTWNYQILENEGKITYLLNVPCKDAELKFVLSIFDEVNAILFFNAANAHISFTKDCTTDQHLSGSWGIAKDEWGGYSGECSYWLQFNTDRTVSGNIDGYFAGTWYPIITSSDNTTGVLIEYENDGVSIYLKGTLDKSSNEFFLFDDYSLMFQKVNDIEFSVIQTASQILLGSWTGIAEVKYPIGLGDNLVPGQSIAFMADRTFTAVLFDKAYHGVWDIQNYSYTEFAADEAIPYMPDYYLRLQFSGGNHHLLQSSYCLECPLHGNAPMLHLRRSEAVLCSCGTIN